MEQYIVSARKYRPATFDQVVGQHALASTLKNAIATDRLAHAYLFCGSRGVGKTSCARIFAKSINCLNPGKDGEACNECASCRAFNDGNSMNIIELDAASHNGIEDIKSLIEQVMVPPTLGKYRVFIIDEVHMLSTAAFNAFLKTLEEPPSYVIFILATTEKHKIIPTILSRCQIYDFNRITVPDIVAHLQKVADNEQIEVETAALNVIARQADGAMRDALSIFDQVAASSRGKITYQSTIENLNVLDTGYYDRLLDAFLESDPTKALLIFHEVRRKGFDAQFFLNGIAQYMRDLMLAQSPATAKLLDEPADIVADMQKQAARVEPKFLYRAMALCNDADLNYRQSSNKQLLVELTLIRIAQLLSPSPIESGRGEGSLLPIAKSTAPQATPAPTPAAPAPVAQPQQPQPAPAPTPQPAPAPTPRPATYTPGSATPRVGGTAMRVGALSMSGNRAAKSEAVAEQHTEPVTAEGVAAAWQSYIDEHPADYALIQIMSGAKPELVDNRYQLALDVANSTLLAVAMDQIIAHMRSKLRNDLFTFTLQTIEGELPPQFWNERRIFDYMLQQSPLFASFCKDLDLKLL